MTKSATLMLALAFGTGAQPTPNFTGVWELNKSGSPEDARMPDSMKVGIDQKGQAFEVTMRVISRGVLEQQSHRSHGRV